MHAMGKQGFFGILINGMFDLHHRPSLMDVNYSGIDWRLVTFGTVASVVYLYSFKWLFHKFFSSFYNEFSVEKCLLPPSMPFLDAADDSSDWKLKVIDATESQLDEFLINRNNATIEKLKKMNLDEKRKLAAKESYDYQRTLYDHKAGKYFFEKFANQVSWPYPALRSSWHGWSGFYAELSPATQALFTGNCVYFIEHGLVTLLSLYYFFNCTPENIFYLRSALYIDIGFNFVDGFAMFSSLLYKKVDFTVYMGIRTEPGLIGATDLMENSGIWKLLGLHHIGAAIMELIGLYFNIDPAFASSFAVSLIGSGWIHCLNGVADYSPFRQNKTGWFLLSAATLVQMVFFRAIIWLPMCYEGWKLAFHHGGWSAATIVSAAMLLFSLFNIDFIRFYISKTTKAYSIFSHGKSLDELNKEKKKSSLASKKTE